MERGGAGEAAGGARRGRREAVLDASVPVHRRAFAQRLRDLRAECQAPTYRELSRHAHCASGTLSEAAGGRRLPTWETTKAYVTGCLRHAGRDGELAVVLPRWRSVWERAMRAEEPAAPLVIVVPPPPPRRPVLRRTRTLIALAVLMLAGFALPGHEPARPGGAGFFTIVFAPVERPGGDPVGGVLGRELDVWAAQAPSIRVRDVAGPPARLETIAADLHADMVVRPLYDPAATRIEILVADRAFVSAPEFAGRHDLTWVAPPQQLAAVTRRYLGAVVDFARGLDAFARAEFPTAESAFRSAGAELAGAPADRLAVVETMVGSAVGARDPARAVHHFRQALHERPGYGRAEVGLAEALRASSDCSSPDAADTGRLTEADQSYERFLRPPPDQGIAPPDPLLEMTAQLGLALTDQCRSQAGAALWDESDEGFAAVVLLYRNKPLTGPVERRARWLAAEAWAGQGLNAMNGHHSYANAAADFEEAIDMLAGIAETNVAYLEREREFLIHLRGCYQRLARADMIATTDARLERVDRQLSRPR